jgi:hypothetical protein
LLVIWLVGDLECLWQQSSESSKQNRTRVVDSTFMKM